MKPRYKVGDVVTVRGRKPKRISHVFPPRKGSGAEPSYWFDGINPAIESDIVSKEKIV